MRRLTFAVALLTAGVTSGVAPAQDFVAPSPAGPAGDPQALLEGAPPATPAPFAVAGATTRWFRLPDLDTRATALAGTRRGAVAAAGLSQTGDPEQGWTAFGLVLGGAERGAGGSIRAIVRRDRAPDPAPGPLGKGVGLEAGAAAWVAAGGGIALWASAPQLRVRGAAPPLRRGLEIGGLWHAPAGGLWLTRRAAPPGASAPADHELGLSLAAGPCAVWGRARDAPLRGGIGVAARAGVVRAAAEVSSHPVLGETVSLMVMLERRGGGHAPVEPPSVPSSDALP